MQCSGLKPCQESVDTKQLIGFLLCCNAFDHDLRFNGIPCRWKWTVRIRDKIHLVAQDNFVLFGALSVCASKCGLFISRWVCRVPEQWCLAIWGLWSFWTVAYRLVCSVPTSVAEQWTVQCNDICSLHTALHYSALAWSVRASSEQCIVVKCLNKQGGRSSCCALHPPADKCHCLRSSLSASAA